LDQFGSSVETRGILFAIVSVIFAILGFRSLYFVLEALTRYLVHLEAAVIVLLFFVAGKMALQSWNHVISDTGIPVSPQTSVLIVTGTLALGVIASLVFPIKTRRTHPICRIVKQVTPSTTSIYLRSESI
jgi:tellurite resistance protein TerC